MRKPSLSTSGVDGLPLMISALCQDLLWLPLDRYVAVFLRVFFTLFVAPGSTVGALPADFSKTSSLVVFASTAPGLTISSTIPAVLTCGQWFRHGLASLPHQGV